MADNKKYFLDLSGLQSLWTKMKSTFATKSDISSVESNISNINGQLVSINTNLEVLRGDIDGVEALTLSYAPKLAKNYSDAVSQASNLSAGTIIIVGESETIGDNTYLEGFYIVDGDKSVHYIGTSTGVSTEDEIKDLQEQIKSIESQIIKNAAIIDENGNPLSTFTITNNSLLVVYDNAVEDNSTSLNALTHRAISAKFKEIENRIDILPQFKIDVVDELPTNSISLTTIYLLKNDNVSQNNLYTEYIYIENKGWEKLGEQSIVLDNYVTKEFLTDTVNNALASYAKTSEVLSEIQSAKADVINYVDTTFITKEFAEGFATEDSILESIQNGKIGNAIMITDEQIEALS